MHGIKAVLFDRDVLVADIPAFRDEPAMVSMLPGVDVGMPRLLASYRCLALGRDGQNSLAEILSQAKMDLPIWDDTSISSQRFESTYYEQAVKALGAVPEETCIVTGNYHDVIMPAKMAGIKGVLLTTQMGRFPEAELVVPTFAQLLMFIET